MPRVSAVSVVSAEVSLSKVSLASYSRSPNAGAGGCLQGDLKGVENQSSCFDARKPGESLNESPPDAWRPGETLQEKRERLGHYGLLGGMNDKGSPEEINKYSLQRKEDETTRVTMQQQRKPQPEESRKKTEQNTADNRYFHREQLTKK